MTRVRIVRSFYWKAENRTMRAGDVGEVPDADAQLWLRHGMAMQDKTVDVPETKAVLAVPEPKPAVTRKPRKVKRTGK